MKTRKLHNITIKLKINKNYAAVYKKMTFWLLLFHVFG